MADVAIRPARDVSTVADRNGRTGEGLRVHDDDDDDIDPGSDEFLNQTYAILLSNPRRALRIGERALANASARGDREGMARALYRIGSAHLNLETGLEGEPLRRCHELAASSPDLTLQARVQLACCVASAAGGEYATALVHAHEAIGLALAIERNDLLALALGQGGNLLAELGEYEAALDLFDQRSALLGAASEDDKLQKVAAACSESKAWYGRARELEACADAAGAAAALDCALDRARSTLNFSRGVPLTRTRIEALDMLVDVQIERGDVASAREATARIQDLCGTAVEPGSMLWGILELTDTRVALAEGKEVEPLLERLKALESIRHAEFVDGDYGIKLMRALSTAFERSGDLASALRYRKRWTEARNRREGLRARERMKLMQQTAAALHLEAQGFIAKDLRGPLSEAIERIEGLLAEPAPEQIRARLLRARTSTQRALDMADQYLGVINAEYMRRDDLVQLDLSALVKDVCDQMTPPGADARRLVCEADPGLRLAGDAGLLARALQNLVSNALSHAPPETAVRVSARRLVDEIVLAVGDQGPGLPSAMRTRLFQRYATDRAYSGNGLGLALVARVARLHGARVSVDSAPATGTTIRLHFDSQAPH